ncbi:DUF1573 domain-containing protein [bacterium]|nr:MAG: DUF1573 domain-containing protein [bacterium]
MTAAIVLALLTQGDPRPSLPSGTSAEFAQAALAVEARLAAGDVAGAREAARALPVRAPKVAWANEESVPAELRNTLKAGFTTAVGRWARGATGFAPTISTSGADLIIDFARVLEAGKDGLPLTTKAEGGVPFRAAIGLSRGKPEQPVTAAELNMEIAYTLGRYLGVPENPFPGSSMYRDARSGLASYWPLREEAIVAGKNLDLADKLRAGIETGRPIGLTSPLLELVKPSFDLGEAPQGGSLSGTIEVKNNGEGPLDLVVKPDCNCFRLPGPTQIPAHGSKQIRFLVDTTQYVGRQDKVLLLVSNDPLRPNIQIPVAFRSKPPFRLIRPGGDNFVVPSTGGSYDLFLFGTEATLKPTSAKLEGVPGKVTIAPWTGPLADPDMQEGATPRKGWKLRIQIPPTLPAGRTDGIVSIGTTSPKLKGLRYGFTAQKGIVPLPESTYFGDVKVGSKASFFVSRPNAPFKILSVDAGPFRVTWRDSKGGWEYVIELTYPGGAAKGDFLIPVRVRTDDPKQPLVEALINGNIR